MRTIEASAPPEEPESVNREKQLDKKLEKKQTREEKHYHQLERRFGTARKWLAQAPRPISSPEDATDLGAQAVRLQGKRLGSVLDHLDHLLVCLVAAIQEESRGGFSTATIIFRAPGSDFRAGSFIAFPADLRKIPRHYRVRLTDEQAAIQAKYWSRTGNALIWYFQANRVKTQILHRSKTVLAVTCDWTAPASTQPQSAVADVKPPAYSMA